MYEARQHKDKVSRRIDGSGLARQRVDTENNKDSHPIKGESKIQSPIIQLVNGSGFHETIKPNTGYITLAVDCAGFGHTYIIIEMNESEVQKNKGKNLRRKRKKINELNNSITRNMYHFKADAKNMFTKISKLFSWNGIFEKIDITEEGKNSGNNNNNQDEKSLRGRTPEEFVNARNMLVSELSVSADEAKRIKEICEQECEKHAKTSTLFSLLLSNIGIGNNCFSKVYNILRENEYQLTWSSYLLSFASPRLALSFGSGFYKSGAAETKSSFWSKPPKQRLSL